MRQRWGIALVMLLGVCFFMAAAGSVRGEWTTATEPNSIASAGTPDAETITFAEYPDNTYITTQYGNRGIVFGGDTPFITTEGNFKPEIHVLSGYPRYTGAIEGWFVDPNDPNTPTTVNGFSLDAGYFDNLGSTRLAWFDSAGRKLGEQFNSKTGIETFTVHDIGIAHWRIAMLTYDAQGYVIDNFKIETPPTILVSKRDDTEGQCQDLWDEYNYTITYLYPDDPNHTRQPLTGITLVDYLPREVDYMPPSSPDGSYDVINHKIIWNLGTIYPGIPGTITLTVMVNEQSEPNGILINEAELRDAEGNVLWTAVCETKVCCRGGDVIYVDDTATGYNNGTSWANAYTDLQAAIARADKGCGTQIWIAKGVYNPGDDVTDSFTFPAGISVYGGFAGYETDPNQRNIAANPTILSGDTGVYDFGTLRRNTTVVTMMNSLLDGVIVSNAQNPGQGILCHALTSVIVNCMVENNQQYGIYADDSNVSIKWCTIKNNQFNGVYHLGHNSKTLTIENCQIFENRLDGIYTELSTSTILNNVIFKNGFAGSGYYGINLFQPLTGSVVRNNTIVYNTNEGIRSVGSNMANVRNCIFYGNKNNAHDGQFSGNPSINYSLVYDPNYPNQTTPDLNGNISCNPLFAYNNPNLKNFHLAANSPCINQGSNTGIATDETDMDHTERIYDNIVDMGADEVRCSDVYNEYDWDADGLVNLREFAVFSAAWLTYEPNNPNIPNPVDPNAILHWNSVCDLDSDLDVDLADLITWIGNNWLWVACWRADIQEMQTAAATSSTSSLLESSVQTESISSASMLLSKPSALSEESACQTEPDSTASVLSVINELLETQDADREALWEIKNILEQSLVDTGDTETETVEF